MMKKGQAAMEYLMTYGWAILVIVVVLAALLYLGVFNVPTPERCQLQTGLQCSSFRILSNGKLNISIANGLQKEITITKARCTQDSNFASGDDTKYETLTPATAISVGSTKFLPYTQCQSAAGVDITSGTVGSSYVGKLYIKYYYTEEGTSAMRVNAGEVSLKYQPA